MRLGIVADDITGANDAGGMFARTGWGAFVFPIQEEETFDPRLEQLQQVDVAVLDTNSRLDDRQTAYRKVRQATRQLRAAGCEQFFNKTCSVFRGNIGAEFDAMLDELQQEFAVVVLGFPKNGRLTIDGIHYVHGRRLEDSEFRADPVHPMLRSDLVGILQQQTTRIVDRIGREIVSAGPDSLRAEIGRRKAQCNYVILDVTCQEDLKTIAAAVQHEPVLCGSSALGEELAALWKPGDQPQPEVQMPPRTGLGVFCVAGSLMPQTAEQIRQFCAAGASEFSLSPVCLFDPNERRKTMARLVDQIIRELRWGKDVCLHSVNAPALVERNRSLGIQKGLGSVEISRLVSAALAEVTAGVVESSGLNRLIVCGGETSAAVCTALGVSALRVRKEIQPGLPSCLTLPHPSRFLILKSGSFGSQDFLMQASEHLKGQ